MPDRTVGGMYTLLVLFHSLSAMVWVGGGLLLLAVLRRARRRSSQEAAARMTQELEWVHNWIFIPAPLLVVATGITMVAISNVWAFSHPWIYHALGLIVVVFVGMDPGVRPVLKRLKAARESGTTSGKQYGADLQGYFPIGTVVLSPLVVVVFLMVFKPGV